MEKIFLRDQGDPAMNYEILCTFALDCTRLECWDCSAGFYDENFVPEINDEGTSKLIELLNALAKKTESSEKVNEFLTIRDSITSEMEQIDGLHMIDYIAKIWNED